MVCSKREKPAVFTLQTRIDIVEAYVNRKYARYGKKKLRTEGRKKPLSIFLTIYGRNGMHNYIKKGKFLINI